MIASTSKKVVFPGTFDPVTYGHLDIVVRASKIFDHVVIAVAKNPRKKPLFSLDERVELFRTALQDFKITNIEIFGFEDLLVNFVAEHHAYAIIKGIRVVSDFEYEFQLAAMNRVLAPQIESIFLTPAEKYAFISSSLVKEVASLKGDVTRFVPASVIQALKEKL